MKHSSSPTVAVLLMYGIESTLNAWLDFNGVRDVYDAELLEVIPAEFRDEYMDRLRLNSHYERKFAEHCDEASRQWAAWTEALRDDENASSRSRQCSHLESSRIGSGSPAARDTLRFHKKL